MYVFIYVCMGNVIGDISFAVLSGISASSDIEKGWKYEMWRLFVIPVYAGKWEISQQ